MNLAHDIYSFIVGYQDPLSLASAYSSASLTGSSAIPSPDSCLKPELGYVVLVVVYSNSIIVL